VTVVSTTRTTAYRTLLLSLALFTITPLRQRWIPPADRAHARVALEWLPLIGLLLGAVVGGVAIGLRHAGPLVAATAAVAVLAVATRGLHLDGLADVADGLGSRRDPAEARAIMKKGDVGPFGVVAVVLVLVLDIACYASILGRFDRLEVLVASAAVVGSSRGATLLVSGRELPPAAPDGFGALVAGSSGLVERARGVGWSVLVIGLAGGAAGLGARSHTVVGIAVLLGPAVAYAFAWHCSRRFGGMTGDVFGAVTEIACAASLLVIAAAL
jgi:adenosylcobinamide-GDP ribazoletransferase